MNEPASRAARPHAEGIRSLGFLTERDAKIDGRYPDRPARDAHPPIITSDTCNRKRTMTKPNFTDITIILDRSGSMSSVAGDTVGGLNRFIEDQKKVPGGALFSLLQFDTEVDYIRRAVPLAEVAAVKPEEFVPRGATALHDAICIAIDDAGTRLGAIPEPERPSTVLVVILTDGMENASNRFSREKVRERIERQTKEYNWQFIYLGANQDAIMTGASLGVGAGNSANYMATAKGMNVAVAAASSAGAMYRSTATADSLSMQGMQNLGEDGGVIRK